MKILNKILKPRYLLVLLVLGGGALFTVLQGVSSNCVSTASGDLTRQNIYGDYQGSVQSSDCGLDLSLNYFIGSGTSVYWSGFGGEISGNVEVESDGVLDINGNATFGGTLTNAGTISVEAPTEPAAPTAPSSDFYTISNISGHTLEDGTTSTFPLIGPSKPLHDTEFPALMI